MTHPSEATNPYEPPKSPLGVEAARASELEVIAYSGGEEAVQPATEYYAQQARRHGTGLWLRLNIPALLLGSVWCFWRKLYLVGCALYLVELVLSTLIYLIALALLPGGELSPQLSWIPFLSLPLARVPFALLANRLYLRAATRAASKLRDRGLAGEAILHELRRKGGTSSFGAGAAILVNIAFRILDRLAA